MWDSKTFHNTKKVKHSSFQLNSFYFIAIPSLLHYLYIHTFNNYYSLGANSINKLHKEYINYTFHRIIYKKLISSTHLSRSLSLYTTHKLQWLVQLSMVSIFDSSYPSSLRSIDNNTIWWTSSTASALPFLTSSFSLPSVNCF